MYHVPPKEKTSLKTHSLEPETVGEERIARVELEQEFHTPAGVCERKRPVPLWEVDGAGHCEWKSEGVTRGWGAGCSPQRSRIL